LRFNSSSSPSSLPSLPVSRHRRLRCDAALRQIVAMVSQIGGPEALEDLAVELALKVAELVEQIASAQGLPAADVADILFID
jgi:hypothetical protein